jgi:hypothetical protein
MNQKIKLITEFYFTRNLKFFEWRESSYLFENIHFAANFAAPWTVPPRAAAILTPSLDIRVPSSQLLHLWVSLFQWYFTTKIVHISLVSPIAFKCHFLTIYVRRRTGLRILHIYFKSEQILWLFLWRKTQSYFFSTSKFCSSRNTCTWMSVVKNTALNLKKAK